MTCTGEVGGEAPDIQEIKEVLEGGPLILLDMGQDQGMVVRGGKRDLLRPGEVRGDRDGKRDRDLQKSGAGIVDNL